jgi:hypothetical protein
MENLIGQTFGNLHVIDLHQGLRKKGNRLWLCKCVCGNTVLEITGKLKYGHKTSCGCMRKKRAEALKKFGAKHRAWRGCGDISGSVWHRIVASAKKRHKKISIDIDYVWHIFLQQEKRCALSGKELYFAQTSKELASGMNTASLDRIDNSKGYIQGNVQWVHVKVNYMKQATQQDEFLEWCQAIAHHLTK